MQPFSKHAGFFASLKQVEDRLASEQQQEQRKPPPPQQPESSPFSDTMTASSPIFLNATTSTTADSGGAESSGPALDFLTLSKDEEHIQEHQEYANGNDDSVDDIARLMALLGLSPPPGGGDDGGDCNDSGGCNCSGADGFMAKVVGVVGPKCEKEKRRVDRWIKYYCRGGGCMEPARLSHLLLAKASWSWDDEGPGGRTGIVFPATVKEFLDHDTPPRWPEEEEGREAQ